ncbi:hypothetical protein PMAYCL1PPCAC_29498, partial [Pristionchus mayeri]
APSGHAHQGSAHSVDCHSVDSVRCCDHGHDQVSSCRIDPARISHRTTHSRSQEELTRENGEGGGQGHAHTHSCCSCTSIGAAPSVEE